MISTDDTLLWQLMADADVASSWGDPMLYRKRKAAEIRAVAKAVPNTCLSAADVRHWLIDQADHADRAERGEVG